jgi:Ni/Co efflux regulator RcnB
VRERLTHPHPVIAGWQAAQQGWQRSELDRRRHRLLDALFKALERRGAVVREPVRYQVVVEVAGEAIEVQLREGEKQVRRPLTDDEKARPYAPKSGYRQERRPTGRLIFTIKTWLPGGLPTQWRETKTAPMEVLLPDIVAVLLAAGPLLAEQRRQREEAEHRRRLAEHQRWEEQQRQKRDDNRWRRLVDIAEQHREAEVVRELLAALGRTPADSGAMIGERSLGEWLAWAAERIREADPLTYGTEAVFRSVASVTEYNYRRES